MSEFILPPSKMEKHRRFKVLEVNQLSCGKLCYLTQKVLLLSIAET